MNIRNHKLRLRQLGCGPRRRVRVSLTGLLVTAVVIALVAFEVGLNLGR